jgi:hypothetical protein
VMAHEHEQQQLSVVKVKESKNGQAAWPVLASAVGA